ncbi:MAG: elongation factor P [Candidatus Omnitrophica bacterium]|nr:elongation factor P [Candidatus Omnitrophota bacterium]
MITPKQFSNGQCIIMNGELNIVVFTQHKRTAQRGAVVRTRLKNYKTGAVTEFNLAPDETFEEAYVEKRALQYLYCDGEVYHFMDHETYEQYELTKELLGDTINFLKENTDVTVKFYEKQPIGIDLPTFIDLEVTYTEPGFKGNTSTGGTKPATVETGAEIKVPLFIGQGEKIRIDTRTGEYVSRI